MEPPVMSDELGGITTEWKAFVICLDAGLAKTRRRFWHPYLLYLETWHQDLIQQLQSAEAIEALATSWPSTDSLSSPDRQVAASVLLREELRGVTEMLASVTGTDIELPPLPSQMPPPKQTPKRKRGLIRKIKEFLTRPIGLKDALKAGGTLVESIKDLLEEAPAWLKALLTISKEALDTVAD